MEIVSECAYMMILANTKHQKKTWKKKKQLLDFFGGRETIFYRCTQETTVQENIVRMKSALGPSMNLSKGHSYITYSHFLIIMDGPLLKSTCRGVRGFQKGQLLFVFIAVFISTGIYAIRRDKYS